jgi:hypothetical protein
MARRPSRCTFTATSKPPCWLPLLLVLEEEEEEEEELTALGRSTARWTCPKLAAARGVVSNSRNSWDV